MRLLSILVLAMLLFGCGGGNFNQKFATITNSQLVPQGRMHLILTQQGNNVTGQVTFENSTTYTGGTFFGTTNGDTISNFQLQLNSSGQACQASGTGTYANWQLNLNITSMGTCGGGGAAASSIFLQAYK